MAPDHVSVYKCGWDLLEALRSRGICYARMKSRNGHTDVETESVVTRIVPSNYRYFDGLRCDVCFGFPTHMLPMVSMGRPFNRPISEAPDYIYSVERIEAAKNNKPDGLRTTFPAIDEMCTYPCDIKTEELYLTMPPRNGKSLYRHALNALYGKTPSIPDYTKQMALYAALMKGENNMPTEVKDYVRNDITTLADAFRNITLSFNRKLPGIKTVHFSGPVTAVIWEDKTKTIVRCKDGDVPDYEKGLAMAIAKKALGTNKSGSNYYDIFKKWLPKPVEVEEVGIDEPEEIEEPIGEEEQNG